MWAACNSDTRNSERNGLQYITTGELYLWFVGCKSLPSILAHSPAMWLRLAGVSVSDISVEYGQDISFRNALRSPARMFPVCLFPEIGKKTIVTSCCTASAVLLTLCYQVCVFNILDSSTFSVALGASWFQLWHKPCYKWTRKFITQTFADTSSAVIPERDRHSKLKWLTTRLNPSTQLVKQIIRDSHRIRKAYLIMEHSNIWGKYNRCMLQLKLVEAMYWICKPNVLQVSKAIWDYNSLTQGCVWQTQSMPFAPYQQDRWFEGKKTGECL